MSAYFTLISRGMYNRMYISRLTSLTFRCSLNQPWYNCGIVAIMSTEKANTRTRTTIIWHSATRTSCTEATTRRRVCRRVSPKLASGNRTIDNEPSAVFIVRAESVADAKSVDETNSDEQLIWWTSRPTSWNSVLSITTICHREHDGRSWPRLAFFWPCRFCWLASLCAWRPSSTRWVSSLYFYDPIRRCRRLWKHF